jgi:pimeloyl-ACP methyl ester carboxylesterase
LATLFRRRQREAGGLKAYAMRVGDDKFAFLDRDEPGEKRDADESRETIVMVHGFAVDKDSWTLLVPHISRRYRVIALDLPGFGNSSHNANQSFDVKSQARRLGAFLDALRVRGPHVVANSMGGNIVARLAVDEPHRFASITLISPLGVQTPATPSDAEVELASGHNPLIVETDNQFDHLMRLVFTRVPEALSQSIVRRYFADQAIAESSFARKIFGDLRDRPDWLQQADLVKIKVPTLVVWGDADRILSPSAAPIWAQHISGAQLEIMRGCGHAPMAERPADTAFLLNTFFAGLTNS